MDAQIPGTLIANKLSVGKRPLRANLVAVAVCFLLCGCETGGNAHVASVPGRLMFIRHVNDQDRLYSSDVDGYGQKRILIGQIAVAPVHRIEPAEANLTDESQIWMMGYVRFSPDGSRLILNVSRGPDQSQLVVVDAHGGHARTASEQTGYILDAASWSPDLSKIAYTQTDFGGANPRVMVTNLVTDEVSQVGLSYCGALEWDTESAGFYCASYDQNSDTSSLYHFDIGSGLTEVVRSSIAGNVNAISDDGDVVLLVRQVIGGGEALVRYRFATGEETQVFGYSGSVGGRFLYSPDGIVFNRYPTLGGDLPSQYARVESTGVTIWTIRSPSNLFVDFYPN